MILAGGESQQDVDIEDADRVNAHRGTYTLSLGVIATANGWKKKSSTKATCQW